VSGNLRLLTLSLSAAAFMALLAGGCSFAPQADDEPILSLVEQLESNDAQEKVAALEQLGDEALGDAETASQVTASVANRVTDANARVRRAAIEAVGRLRPTGATRIASTALQDRDLQVRLAAIETLGAISDREAIILLHAELERPGAALRVAAVKSLGRAGEFEAVRRAADDQDWRVRQAAAESLGDDQSLDAAQIAERLIADRSSAVQQATIDMIESWPIDRAGPILLEGAKSTSLLVRRSASEQLARRWKPANELSIELPPGASAAERARWLADRGERINDLGRRFAEEFPPIAAPAIAVKNQRQTSQAALDHAKRLVDALAQSDVSLERRRWLLSALSDLGDALLPALEAMADDPYRGAAPEAIYLELLPAKHAEFALLVELSDQNIVVRRRAAKKLAAMAAEKSLSSLATKRLIDVAMKERDALVWSDLLPAISSAPTRLAEPMLLAALTHPSAEVRRRACEILADRPDDDFRDALIPALDDDHAEVTLAALDALCEGAPLSDPSPVLRLLSHAEFNVRFKAISTLALWRCDAGSDALQRLANDSDPRRRQLAAQAMGQSGDNRFSPTLVAMLDDRTPVAQAAIGALEALENRSFRVTLEGAVAPFADQVRRWKDWGAKR
jgi:HEAT repeat protein